MPSYRPHAFCVLTDLVSLVTIDLLGEFGIEVRALGAGGAPETDGEAIAATIGYAGDQMRGALMLFAPSDGAMALWPPETDIESTPVAMRDLVGEFANMLIGRIKLRLLSFDVLILLATPTTASGAGMRVDGAPDGSCVWLAFESPHGALFVRFDAVFVPSFEMKDSPVVHAVIVPGQPLMF